MAGFKKLLVPLDGSRLAEAVLPVTALLARSFDASVSLLHVMERGAPDTIHGEPHLADASKAQEYLDTVAADLERQGVRVETHVHPNLERDVVASIIGHAQEFGTDLIAMATHGSGGMRDILVGSIAQQVLRRGKCPVLLVRPLAQGIPQPYQVRRILAPLDGTPAHDDPVVPVAEEVARRLDSDLHLLVVVPTRGTVSGDKAAVATLMPSATRAVLEIEQQEAAEYLRGLAGRLRSGGVRVSAEVRRGDPAGEVAKETESDGADLIVMSTHARSGLEALWQASVGAKILSRIHRPLLLVRVDG